MKTSFFAVGHSNRTLEFLVGLVLGYEIERLVDVRTVPLVMQYNKQDLPRELILTPPELDDALNFRAVPSFPADALHGTGVFETLKRISELVLKKLAAGSPAV